MSNQRSMNRHGLAASQPPDDLSSEAQWMEVDMEVRRGSERRGLISDTVHLIVTQGGTSITADLAQNDRAVHVDFFNGEWFDSDIYGCCLSVLSSCRKMTNFLPICTGFDDIFNDEKLD